MKKGSGVLAGLRIGLGLIILWAFFDKLFGLGLASARFSDHFRAAEGMAESKYQLCQNNPFSALDSRPLILSSLGSTS